MINPIVPKLRSFNTEREIHAEDQSIFSRVSLINHSQHKENDFVMKVSKIQDLKLNTLPNSQK